MLGSKESSAGVAALGTFVALLGVWLIRVFVPPEILERAPFPEEGLAPAVVYLFCRYMPEELPSPASALKVWVVMLAFSVMSVFGASSCSLGMIKGATPAQAFYAVSGEVQLLEDLCNRYADTPTARRSVVKVCAEAATEVHEERVRVVDALLTCPSPPPADEAAQGDLVVTRCPAYDQAVRLSMVVLDGIRTRLHAELVKAGVSR